MVAKQTEKTIYRTVDKNTQDKNTKNTRYDGGLSCRPIETIHVLLTYSWLLVKTHHPRLCVVTN